MAPELENYKTNSKTDVWSIGAITNWLLTGIEPNGDKELKVGDELTSNYSKECADFV